MNKPTCLLAMLAGLAIQPAPLSHQVEARDHVSPSQTVYDGPARVIDGDTIVIAGRHIRLFGIDAPESKQLCDDGWDAGVQSSRHLVELLNLVSVHCEQKDIDKYGRSIGICQQDGVDINAQMVRDGMAWAYTKYSARYVAQEDEAKRTGRGVHSAGRHCELPWRWRAARR